ncbi:iron dicitrate transport regulator FecR [Rhizobium sp. WL3]|uniref:FecR family protein n=1 Tax=Rhizobium sp. WL3 TaxID=2603277 RepID=UPI0011C1FAE3|nr:FecR domain-containing protein [Rhizobium sp. WL3]QEE46587.1 iron dicitrate transport regulator FecR [Rhizobium sp. WL3]
MNETTPDQGRLLDEAIDLVIRRQNDPDNPVSEDLIRAWRACSQQHEDVWSRISRVHGASGKILDERRRIERGESLGLNRRNFLVGGLTVLGLGSVAYSFGPGMLMEARADHMTDKGEIRRIDLPDGSIATLGPESAIALSFQNERREVELLAGMCFFEVAKATDRPFSVVCADLRATALGTAFDVSNDAGIVTVAVDHGLVDVQAQNSPLQADVNLGEGQWVTIDTASGRVDRGQRESGQIAAWRDNLIIAEEETVEALVARIGRWLPGRIVIADPSVGHQRVSGIFDLTNPLRTLEAVVHPAGARIRRVTSFVTVISPL